MRGTSASGYTGPDLTHVAGRRTLAAASIPNTPAYLAGWIRDSQAVKPGNRMPEMTLTDRQLRDLVAYLDELR